MYTDSGRVAGSSNPHSEGSAMKLKVKVDANSGAAYIAAIDPSTGEHRKSTTVAQGQEVELNIPEVADAAGIEFGEPTDTQVEEPAPGGGEEQPGGEQPPAGEGDQGGGEAPPTTSAASELPLYAIANSDADGFTAPEGFVASGLETPEGATLYHYSGDTAGQPHTFDVGSVEDVSLYAETDDNEKPVKVPDAEAAQAGGEGQEAPQS